MVELAMWAAENSTAEDRMCGIVVDERVATEHEACKEGLSALPSSSSIVTQCPADDGADDDQASVCSGLSCNELAEMCALKVQEEEAADSCWLHSGACMIGKARGACEDAFFHSKEALGVADGVSGMRQFRQHGVDAAAYAQELMRLAQGWLQSPQGDMPTAPELRAAAALVAAEEQATGYGASTVSVLHIAGAAVGVANLGDSGFMLLRREATDDFRVVARSKEQTHRFNLPYQLTRLPEKMKEGLRPGIKFDSAQDSELYSLPVQAQDLLLLFTDGFADNVHEHQTLEVVNRIVGAEDDFDPEVLARALAQVAHKQSVDPVAETPFSVAAAEAGQHFPGGKEDDITVVVARVMPSTAGRARVGGA